MDLYTLFSGDIAVNFAEYFDFDSLLEIKLISRDFNVTTLTFINKHLCPKNNIIQCNSLLEYTIFYSAKNFTRFSKNIIGDVESYALFIRFNNISKPEQKHYYMIFSAIDILYRKGFLSIADEIMKYTIKDFIHQEDIRKYPRELRRHIHKKYIQQLYHNFPQIYSNHLGIDFFELFHKYFPREYGIKEIIEKRRLSSYQKELIQTFLENYTISDKDLTFLVSIIHPDITDFFWSFNLDHIKIIQKYPCIKNIFPYLRSDLIREMSLNLNIESFSLFLLQNKDYENFALLARRCEIFKLDSVKYFTIGEIKLYQNYYNNINSKEFLSSLQENISDLQGNDLLRWKIEELILDLINTDDLIISTHFSDSEEKLRYLLSLDYDVDLLERLYCGSNCNQIYKIIIKDHITLRRSKV